jgi:predicted metal-dependent RNase
MQIIEEEGPCIIIATSGMLVGGPSVEYLKHLAENPKNSLVFTCYQGEGSLGRRIQRGERDILMKTNVGGKPDMLQIKMEVHKIEITAHSDRRQLMSFVHRCEPRPKKVIINHGENVRCLDLASSIHRQFRMETSVPRNLESIRVK